MRSVFRIVILSLCWCALFLSLGVFTGLISISVSAAWLANPAAFIFRHLRLSIVPFGSLFLLYFFLITKIRACLVCQDPDVSRISYYDRLLNTTISTFFGVGVIWTAIGMETALVHALETVEKGQEPGAGMSAWGLLERLVNGGLLLALSTTVFGGVCGYALRLVKIIFLGKEWDRTILKG